MFSIAAVKALAHAKALKALKNKETISTMLASPLLTMAMAIVFGLFLGPDLISDAIRTPIVSNDQESWIIPIELSENLVDSPVEWLNNMTSGSEEVEEVQLLYVSDVNEAILNATDPETGEHPYKVALLINDYNVTGNVLNVSLLATSEAISDQNYGDIYALAIRLLNSWGVSVHNRPDLEILVDSWPFPNDTALVRTILGLFSIGLFAFGLTTLPPLFGLAIVRDKETGVKAHLLANGLPRVSYWLSATLFDSAVHIVIGLVGIIAYWLFGIAPSDDTTILGPIFIIIINAPISPLFGYLMAAPFAKAELAQRYMNIIPLLVLGIPLTWALSTGQITLEPSWSLFLVSALIPPAGLVLGLAFIALQSVFESPIDGFGDMFVWDTALPLIMLGTVTCTVVYSLVLFAIEVVLPAQVHKAFLASPPKALANAPEDKNEGDEDKDVSAEAQRVKQVQDNLVSVDRAWRVYPGTQTESDGHLAVAGVSYGMAPGEIFALLGPNGAGKTSLLTMLTGGSLPSKGTISVAADKVGYCPQFDALYEELSARQSLSLFAAIRGVPDAEIEAEVQNIVEALALVGDANKPAKTYSGGNKRKLSVGLALIGQPSVMILDEPSTGLDPSARRHLWEVIRSKREGHVVLLSTHSMEEADALASRIAIMVKGRTKCIGSSQHLKRRFGGGYEIVLNTVVGDEGKAKEFVTSTIPDAQEESAQPGLLRYELALSEGGGQLADVFEALFDAQKKSESTGVIDFTLSEPTLEKIFVRFARQQDS